MQQDVILWSYWNVWRMPVDADPCDDCACSNGERVAFGRVMGKVRAGGPAAGWADTEILYVH
ncbi:MAG: hypothetical protein ACFCUO_11695 [Rhodospirillales bacterium]